MAMAMPVRCALISVVVCICLVAAGCGNSTDALIVQLGDSDPVARRSAARELGNRQEDASRVVAALAKAVEDSDLEVRELASASLGQFGREAKACLPALEQALNDQQSSVRLTAALAIQKIDPHSPHFPPVLIESLRAGDGVVFLELRRMGADAKWAVPTLVRLLAHQQPQIRALAAHALGGIGGDADEVKSAVRRSLRDQDPNVREAAQNALIQIDAQR
jgi:HEAT repeat protein